MRLLGALAGATLALQAATAAAQTATFGERTLMQGLTLPPSSAATVDDVTSGNTNPAGLGLMRDLQFAYVHSREVLPDRLDFSGGLPSAFNLQAIVPGDLVGDGLYGGATLFDVVGLGLSEEWLRPTQGNAYHKTHFGLALSPDRTLSVGLAYNLLGSSDPLLGSLTSWDAGLTLRPWAFLSIGASVLDFDNPSVGATGRSVPRRYDFALALRPFGHQLTLAADYQFLGEHDQDPRQLQGNDESLIGFAVNNQQLGLGPRFGRLGLTGLLDLGPLGIQAGAGIPFGGLGVAYAQVGLSFTADHVAAGLGYAAADLSNSAGPGLFDAYLRLSKNNFAHGPAIFAPVLDVDLTEVLSDKGSGPLSLLFKGGDDPFEQLENALANAARNGDLRAVVLRIDGVGGLGLGRVEELRATIATLRARGKRVIALFNGGGDSAYYLASACDHIYAPPQTDFGLHGFSANSLFFAEGLAKLGIKVDVVRVGPYKSFADTFTRDGPSPEALSVTKALLGDATGRYLAAVSASRGLSSEAFVQVLARGLSTAEQLKSAGLVDEVIYPDQLGDRVSALLGARIKLEGLELTRDAHQEGWGELPRIGVVNVFGTIAGGDSQSSPFGHIAGADTVVGALEAADHDSDVKAVVVRVDSGGGDGSASELIWRAIGQLKRHKPVVVSLGDVAASGGYYLAVAGDEILAQPGTVTGSIGVFALKPDLSGLMGKLGIHSHLEADSPNADLFSLTSPWSEGEKQVLQSYIDAFYATFVDRVSSGRKLSHEAVDAVGRGHVWSGNQARERGLIDGYGSFLDAIAHAKQRAHLADDEQVNLVTFGSRTTLVNLGEVAANAETRELGELAHALIETTGAEPLLLLGGGGGRALALPEELPAIR